MPNAMQWLWDPTAKKWVKCPIHCTVARMTDVGLVYEGAAKLHWIICTPSAGLSLWELTNDLDGSSDPAVDCFSTTRESKMGSFTPAARFSTGIYVKTFTNMTSLTIGYTPE